MADDEHGGTPTISTGEARVDVAQKDASSSEARSSESPQESPSTPRTFVSYTRPQILALYNSPLVKPLDHMPSIREWFGEWPEQNNKNYSDTLTLNAVPRDRRFRRDQDDSDPAPRATFRSGALSQPSQMGNFKHQSTRTSDRDRERERDKDRDVDKERERDIRDREGQERLRSLSDKYDRDRLGSSTTTNGLRGKDRDSAPHLSVGASRLSSGTALTGRRGEGRERGEGRGEREREGGTRRKPGESIEDWRRGRDERSETSRRDSSRHRETSRSRREPSTSRRDRNRDRDDRDRDEHRRRDRGERDREENDDPRRWRDDGKRDERLAARRDRDREPRDRGERGERGERSERGTRDRERRERNGDAWEPERRDRDRGERNDRWTTEEREDRGKRTNGRERRGDDDKEERRDREKEKEPAWMETYVPPSTSGTGILGSKAADGGLDGIQAWKKGMKEKEEKEKAAELAEVSRAQDTIKAKEEAKAAGGGLDEIQMFKQMMKREEEKKKESGTSPNLDSPAADAGPPPGLGGPKGSTSISLATLMGSAATESSPPAAQPTGTAPQPITASTSTTSDVPPSSQDSLRPTGSRFFPAPPSATIPSAVDQPQPIPIESAPGSNLTSPTQQYNPPTGPRLLSLGARPSSSNLLPRTPSGLEPPPSTFGPTLSQLSEVPPPGAFAPEVQQRLGPSESMLGPQQRVAPGGGVRTQMSYPSYENQLRPPITLEDSLYPNDAIRHHAALERAQFGTPPMQSYPDMGGPLGGPQGLPLRGQSPAFDIPERSQGGSPYQSKGSRFAKFFDGGKVRDISPQQMGRPQGGVEYGGQLPNAMQRLDIGGGDMYNGGLGGGPAEGRTMEDLFQMLQNSSQRGPGSMNAPPSMHHAGNAPFNQQQLPVHMHQAERNPPRNIDMLYDNRLDDRNFMPDGMVPGLRSAPPPRGRDSAPIFRDQDDMAFNVQPRLPQQRGIEPAYGVPPPQAYPGQARNIPGQPYRNGVSPVPNQNALLAQQQQQQQQQRLPPGLANLGGRPPHEPQFINGLQGLGGDPRQAQYGGAAGALPIGANGLAGFAGAPQMRGPPPPQQLPMGLGPNALGGAGLPGKMDLRGLSPAQQAQLLGLGAGVGPDARRPSVGMAPPQVNQNALHAQQLLARQQALQQQQQQQQHQQQQQGLPQHMLPRMLPPHMQGAGSSGGPIGQPAQDLMALLMHGMPRE